MKARESVSAGHSTTIGALGRFYARRFLRIFPLYYFVIAVAFVIDLEPARRLIGWLLSYTLNIYMAHNGWFEANFAHFWSLAVEEQFYICWPWLVLFLPRKWLMPAIVAIISVGPLYRLSYSLSGYQNMTGLSTYISTPTSLDNLGFGALLALLVQRYGPEHVLWMRLKRFVFPLAVVASLAILRWGSLDVPTILYGPLQAIVFCCLIYCTSRGIGGPLGRMMEYKPVVYVGKISYGLYVYHPLIPGLVAWLLLKGAKASHPETLLVSALATVITVTVASLSWHLFEKPINDLKRHF